MGDRPIGSAIEAKKDKEKYIQLAKDCMAITMKETRDALRPGKALS